ncbi:MAG TPA: alpha/beta fold hydrolase [Frankiaceae bacterium]|nr:alpha/beta fold hydrolase [Frankiaceae bacterium]
MSRLTGLHAAITKSGVAFIAVGAAFALGVCTASAAAPYPVNYSFTAAIGYTATHDGQPPVGANNWACHPTAAHPDPVVLVHGTFGNMTDSWEALSPLLANAGYCVYALNYGGSSASNPIQATGSIETSAQQLSAFVDKVLASSDARKVDIVGHSQGGMMPRYYLRFLGGAAKVNTLVGLAPSNHGTTLFGLTTLESAFGASGSVPGCAACGEQMAGSTFLTHLNAGHETEPGVHYTVIETKYDEVVTPYVSAFLSPGPTVHAVTLQDGCSTDFSDHLAIIYDRRALAYTMNALDPAHPVAVPCTLVLPGNGG